MGAAEEETVSVKKVVVEEEVHGDDFMPPELMGNMEVVAAQKVAKQKIENDTNRAQQGLVQRDGQYYETVSM